MTKSRNYKFGYCYHITGRGNQKGNIFLDTADYICFMKLLNKYTNIFKVPTVIYCLMPNHYHMILQHISLQGIARTMHMVNTSYTYYMRKRYSWVGHVFQGRYHSKHISNLEYFNTALEYIKQNPVEANLAESFDEYQWKLIDPPLINKVTLLYDLMPRLHNL